MNIKNGLILGIVAAAVAGVVAFKHFERNERSNSVEVASTKKQPVLVDVGAGKCEACKRMMPILDALRDDYADAFRVEYHDVIKEKGVMEKYKISLIPTQIFYNKEGKELFRHEGYYPKEDILKKWNELGLSL